MEGDAPLGLVHRVEVLELALDGLGVHRRAPHDLELLGGHVHERPRLLPRDFLGRHHERLDLRIELLREGQAVALWLVSGAVRLAPVVDALAHDGAEHGLGRPGGPPVHDRHGGAARGRDLPQGGDAAGSADHWSLTDPPALLEILVELSEADAPRRPRAFESARNTFHAEAGEAFYAVALRGLTRDHGGPQGGGEGGPDRREVTEGPLLLQAGDVRKLTAREQGRHDPPVGAVDPHEDERRGRDAGRGGRARDERGRGSWCARQESHGGHDGGEKSEEPRPASPVQREGGASDDPGRPEHKRHGRQHPEAQPTVEGHQLAQGLGVEGDRGQQEASPDEAEGHANERRRSHQPRHARGQQE